MSKNSLLDTAACQGKKEGAVRSLCIVLVSGMVVITIGACSGLGVTLDDWVGREGLACEEVRDRMHLKEVIGRRE